MAVNLSPFGPKPQFMLATGLPAVGYQLFWYVAGSTSTKQNSFTDSTGLVANTNPVVMDALGEPTVTQMWLTSGALYKAVFAPVGDTDPPSSPIWTVDNISGINDVSSGAQNEWQTSGLAPTYVSGTSFTVAGDQTSILHVGRRIKATVTAGTAYGTIISTAFGAVTTVTIAGDVGSNTLDAGLSAVQYGVVTAINPSIDADMVNRKGAPVASAGTTNIWAIAGDYCHITGTTTITSLGTAPYAGAQRAVIFDGILTLTHNATTLVLPAGQSITTAANDRMIVRADTTANMIVVDYMKASGQSIAASTLRDYLDGLTLVSGGGSTTLTVSAGVAADSTNTVLMTLAAAMAKTTGSWVVGAAAGAKAETGATANNTWYHWYLIRRVDTGVVDLCFSTSATGLTAASYVAGGGFVNDNYTQFRFIGSWKTDGSAQWSFIIQDGDLFKWSVPVNDFNTTNPGTAAVLRALNVPLGRRVQAWFSNNENNGSNNRQILWTDPSQTDTAPSATVFSMIVSGVSLYNGSGDFYVFTNTSQQVRYRSSASGASDATAITTKGWIDSRGRNA